MKFNSATDNFTNILIISMIIKKYLEMNGTGLGGLVSGFAKIPKNPPGFFFRVDLLQNPILL